MKIFLLIVVFFFSILNFAQKANISGFITEKESGERLINANIYEKDSYKGTTANDYGFYNFLKYIPKIFYSIKNILFLMN